MNKQTQIIITFEKMNSLNYSTPQICLPFGNKPAEYITSIKNYVLGKMNALRYSTPQICLFFQVTRIATLLT